MWHLDERAGRHQGGQIDAQFRSAGRMQASGPNSRASGASASA